MWIVASEWQIQLLLFGAFWNSFPKYFPSAVGWIWGCGTHGYKEPTVLVSFLIGLLKVFCWFKFWPWMSTQEVWEKAKQESMQDFPMIHVGLGFFLLEGKKGKSHTYNGYVFGLKRTTGQCEISTDQQDWGATSTDLNLIKSVGM